MAARLLMLLLAGALIADDWSVAVSAQQEQATEDVIVVLPDTMETGRVASTFGVDVTYRYTNVFNGFAATVTPEERLALEQIPGAIVSPNRHYEAFAPVTAEE